MSTSSGAIEGLPLQRRREEQDLTQQDVADRLARLAWLQEDVRVGVTADMVSKWERGEKRPSKLYRQLLSVLYESRPDQLGLTRARAPGQPQVRTGRDDDPAIAEALLGTTSILNELGPAGGLLQPNMFGIWKDELVKRRTLLKLLGSTPAAALSAGTTPTAKSVVNPTPDTVETLGELATRYQQLYHSAEPAHLITPILAHLDTITDLLRRRPEQKLRRQLLRNQARAALLAGRIQFFDLYDSIAARGYYNLASESALEASDHLLAAAAQGHTAFIPASENNFNAAQDHLRGATFHLERYPHSLVASWLASVETEIQADAGNEQGALTALERAQEHMHKKNEKESLPDWFDYYDGSRFNGFAGYAYLRFGRFDEARAALTSADKMVAPDAVKQRAVFLTDVASVNLHAGEIDEACRSAGRAVELLTQANYATGTERLREFRRLVEPWKTHPAIRDLDERLALA